MNQQLLNHQNQEYSSIVAYFIHVWKMFSLTFTSKEMGKCRDCRITWNRTPEVIPIQENAARQSFLSKVWAIFCEQHSFVCRSARNRFSSLLLNTVMCVYWHKKVDQKCRKMGTYFSALLKACIVVMIVVGWSSWTAEAEIWNFTGLSLLIKLQWSVVSQAFKHDHILLFHLYTWLHKWSILANKDLFAKIFTG